METADAFGAVEALAARVDVERPLYRRVADASNDPHGVEVAMMIKTGIGNDLRSASEFGPAILVEHRAVLDAFHAGDREATRNRVECAAERLAARGSRMSPEA